MFLEHFIGELSLLHHHLHHALHGVCAAASHGVLLLLHHAPHAIELLLLAVKENLLGLLFGELRGSTCARLRGELSLHEDLLGLGIAHVDLMHLHELLFVETNVVHGLLEEVPTELLLLVNHILDDFLVLAHLTLFEESAALGKHGLLVGCEPLLRMLLNNKEDFLVVVELQHAVGLLLWGTQRVDFFQNF